MYKDILEGFLENIEALKEFVDSVDPVLKEAKLYDAVPLLKEDKLTVTILLYILENTIQEFENKIGTIEYEEAKVAKSLDLKAEREEEIKKLIKEKYNRDVKVDYVKNENGGGSIDIDNLEGIDLDVHMSIIEEIVNLTKKNRRNYEILYKSSLMNLVVYLESMIAEVFRENFNKYPGKVVNKKTLTFEEIKNMGSFEEATSYLIENEIEAMMYKSFVDWCAFLKKENKLKMSYLDKEQINIVEIICRRNLFVHNRGIVNQIYLSKVDDRLKESINIGERLKVDRDYIDNAVKTIERVGCLILIEVWYSEEGKNKKVRDELFTIGYRFMKEEKWKIALFVYELLSECKTIEQKDKLMAKINKWQCMKWDGHYNKIKDVVELEDFSAYSMEYQICVAALRDDYTTVFKLLPKMYEENGIETIEEWPIFKDVRNKEEYKVFLESINNASEQISS